MVPSFATPKPVCGGPCGQPSAWMPPTVSQDTTQSLWDPTLGSPGHLGSGEIQPSSSQICHTKLPKPPGDHLVDPKTRLLGSLWATKCLDASYSVPRHHTISMGPYHGVPWAPWVQQNRKKPRISPISGSQKKTQVKNPKTPRKSKNRNSAKMRPSTFLLRTIWSIYSG